MNDTNTKKDTDQMGPIAKIVVAEKVVRTDEEKQVFEAMTTQTAKNSMFEGIGAWRFAQGKSM
ncbi:MAG: hypothetical protein JW812_02955 [Alphaproteobacteria bacterium]|nr:hypothetical protein [Alphaproteobacteria bacterium]MBN2779507.1 hypothetical protein [Alphaproteobacteria bacterium]